MTVICAAPRHGRQSAARLVLLSALGFGVVLRVLNLLGDRDPWGDELMVLDSLYHRSFLGLLAPLEANQMAPYGWLWAERLAIAIAGPTVMAARLVSFVSGIAALLLFGWLAWRRLTLRPWEAAWAALAFAVLEPLVYFSAEVKQYGSDVFAATCALALFVWLRRCDHWRARHIAVAAAAGALAVVVSHPVALVLGAVGAALALERLRRRDWPAVAALALIAAVWLASFAAVYALSLSDPTLAFKRSAAFPGRYAPLPPRSQADLLWYYDAIGWLFDALGVGLPGLAALFLVAGAIELARRDRWLAAAALLPLPLVLLMSALHLYPFWHRLLLFLAPGIVATIAVGVGAVFDGGYALRPAAMAGAVLLLAFPVAQTVAHGLRHPAYAREEATPLLAHIAEAAQPGDTVFVAFGAAWAWRLYAQQFPALAKLRVVFGEDPGKMNERSYARLLGDLAQAGRTYALFITDPIAGWQWTGVPEARAFDIFATLEGGRADEVIATDGGLMRHYRFGAAPPLLHSSEDAR